MREPRDTVLSISIEVLIIGTLLFAVVSYTTVGSWQMVLIHWGTLALAVLTAYRAIHDGDVRVPRTWLHLPIALLALAAVLSTASSIYRYDSIRETLRILNYIALFYLAAANLTTQRAVTRFLTVLVVAAALLPLAGAMQEWAVAGRAVEITSLLPRPLEAATFGNRDHFAAFLALVLPAGLGLAGYAFRQRRWDWFALVAICLVLVVISLLETLTRAAWMGVTLALLGGMGLFGVTRAIPREYKSWVALGAVVSLLLVVGLAPAPAVERLKTVASLGDADSGMAFRYAVWRDSLRVIHDHLVRGTGPGSFSIIYTQYRSAVGDLPLLYVDFLHNDYLQYAVEMGVVGGGALAVIFLLLIYSLGRSALSHFTDPNLPLVLGALGSVVAFLVAVLYSFEFYITANGLLFWTIAALGIRLITVPYSPRPL